MAAWDWFLSLFNKDTGSLDLDAWTGEIAGEIFFKELAVQASINLIANAVSRSKFRTYEKGKKVKKNNHYLFNVEPNPNKSANKFWRDIISRLVYDNECLVIQQGKSLYVADDFQVEKFAFRPYVYHDIVIDDYQLSNSYIEPDVFHFELHNDKIRNLIEGLNGSYSKLIAISQQNYKRNNSRRGKLKIESTYSQKLNDQKSLEDVFKEKFKRFFEAENGAILPLPEGLDYEDLQSNIGTKGGADNNAIRSFIDDIFDFVAIAFQIPPQLLKGEVANTGDTVNNLLTFCINPLTENLEDEINRKYYGRKNYLEKTYIKVDTSMIKAVNIEKVANALDVLTRIGAFTIDDSLETLGMEPLETDWSKTHFMTKNYEEVKDRINNGGD